MTFQSPSRINVGLALALAAVFTILLMTEAGREQGTRRTEPLRENLARLRQQLSLVDQTLDLLHEVNESRQIALMEDSLTILKTELLPYLAAEEAVLYPGVDRCGPAGPAPFTQFLREEHRILRRWIQDMEGMAAQPMPDHNAFARRGERLMGLLEAHFEVEEGLLFPILDQPAARSALRPESLSLFQVRAPK